MANRADGENCSGALESDSAKKPCHVLFISLYNSPAKGVRHLSAILKQNGYKTSIIFFKDFSGPNTLRSSLKENELLIDKIRSLQPDIIGLSCISSLCNEVLIETSKLIKTNFDNIPLMCGGNTITTSPEPEQFLSHCDYLFMGECEDIIVDIVKSIESNVNMHLLPNLCYTDGSVYKKNEMKSLSPSLDISYFPDLGGEDKFLIDNDQMLCIDPSAVSTEYSIQASRGCPYKCSYCSNSNIKNLYKNKGKYVRTRSVKNVMDELKYAQTKLSSMKIVRFWDEIFPVNEDWVEEFCSEYKQNINLPFIIWSHPLQIKKNNFDLLVKAGLQMVVIGLQHGSQRIRNEIYLRHESDEAIIRASKILSESGVPMVYYDLILDSPFETVEDLKATYILCRKLHKPFSLQFHSLTILPGTEIEKIAIDKGILTSDEVRALQSRPFEEQFKSILWWDVSENIKGKDDEFAYWKRKIYESQFIPEPDPITDDALLKDEELKRLRELVARLQETIKVKDSELENILSSESWRITKPLRVLGSVFRRALRR